MSIQESSSVNLDAEGKLPEYVCIDYPGNVVNVSKMIDTLGGSDMISKVSRNFNIMQYTHILNIMNILYINIQYILLVFRVGVVLLLLNIILLLLLYFLKGFKRTLFLCLSIVAKITQLIKKN